MSAKSETDLVKAMNDGQQAMRPWTRDLAVAMVLAGDICHRAWLIRDTCGIHYAYAQKRRATKAIRAALAVNGGAA